MPLGLLAVGSHLDPSRYEVEIVDGRLEPDPVGAVVEKLDGALCLGISVLTGAPINDAIEISRAAKARFPSLPVVWGGWHPSLFGAECLAEASVDATVQAQGEETFAELVARIESGSPLHGCLGATARGADGTAVKSPPRPFADANGFAPHDYTLLPVERFFTLKGKRQLDYISSQGCFFRCAFCADPYVYGRKWVGLEPARMGEELAALKARYGYDDVNFQDETFFTYTDRVDAIADELLTRGIKTSWAATMRADQGDRLSEDVMAKCRRSGLRRVLVGVESGSQATIDRIKKDITLEQVILTAEKCKRHGVAVQFPFIVCFPDETDESIEATLAFARRLRAMSPTFQTPIFYYKPYPGTPITDKAEREGYVPPQTLDEWARFDWYHGNGPWVTKERERLVERFKFYQRVAYDAGPEWLAPVRRLARWRLEKRVYAWPLEKAVGDLIAPQPALS
jgi:radical SAM superfamily enzyme YgiQ (UPF0313 family)